MAKADKTASENTATAPKNVGGFDISFGDAPAPSQRVGRSADNPVRDAINALPAPQGGKFASFFVPVKAPDNITDPTERTKATKEAQRKETNRLTGYTRRAKKDDASKNFAIRSVIENDVYGVRVYRIAPEVDAAPAA